MKLLNFIQFYPVNQILKTYILGFIIYFFFNSYLFAQETDSLQIVFSKKNYQSGDTILFQVNSLDSINARKASTLHLWIEEINTGKKWHYRYPYINGYLSATLKIDDRINNGNYAFNFTVQKAFFNLIGKVINTEKHFPFLNYTLISKTNQTLINLLPLDDKNSFKLGSILFQDSALIVFSKAKQKSTDLQIKIQTPLDSPYIPNKFNSHFISINHSIDSLKNSVFKSDVYNFSLDNNLFKTILPAVVVNSKSNNQIESFQKENVSGLFAGDAIVLDGLSSDEISNTADLYTYLVSKIGGLRLVTNSENGERFLSWRSKPTEIYIDEVRLDKDIEIYVSPADIAMIKVFRPGESVTMGSGDRGAIAIYLKTGQYKKTNNNNNNSFYILGYTGLDALWR